MKQVTQKILKTFLAVFFLSAPGMVLSDDNSLVGPPPAYEGTVTHLKPVPEGQDGHQIIAPNVAGKTLLFDRGTPMPQVTSDYWIGVQCTEILPPLRAHLNLEEKRGVLIEWVMPESPADKAGVKQYDVFLTLNGKPVGGITEIIKIVEDTKDKELVVSAIRKGKPIELKITPEKRPDDAKVTPLIQERVLRSVQPGVIIEGLGPGVQMRQYPSQELPEDIQKMFEEIQKRLQEQTQLPLDANFERGLGGFNIGEILSGANTVQITIEPAHGDVAASLTVRKNGKAWSVGKFADLPEDVQQEVAEILKNTVDGKDVGDWIAEQMAENRRVTFSVSVSKNVEEAESTEIKPEPSTETESK